LISDFRFVNENIKYLSFIYWNGAEKIGDKEGNVKPLME